MASASGLRRLVLTLADVLCEAVPGRWDDSESFRFRLEDQGLDGLVEFVEGHRGDVLLRPKAPTRRIDLYLVPTSDRNRGTLVSSLQIELDIVALVQPGAGDRFPRAFEQLAEVIKPFYAEARVIRGVPKDVRSGLVNNPWAEQYPFCGNSWWGLPIKAPFAAALAAPYRRHWPQFGSGEVAGMAVENPRPWRPNMPPIRWAVPEGLCQPFDVHFEQIGAADRGELTDPILEFQTGQAFQLLIPDARAPIWPFGDQEP